MVNFKDLKDFFADSKYKVIIASDAEIVTHCKSNGKIVASVRAGGVATALEPIAKASEAVYVARAKTPEDKEVVDKKNKFVVENPDGNYTLKRVFLNPGEEDPYYYGFANQTLWPLCHVAFERPRFDDEWYKGFEEVNKKFAESIKSEIKEKSFIWINDYQLSLVPSYLNKRPKDSILILFWHIPWPTWEIFRILPQKTKILESLLACDYLGFHRGYHARNFIQTVRRELEARIDDEKNQIYYKGRVTTVGSFPLGIDTDNLRAMAESVPDNSKKNRIMRKIVKNFIGIEEDESHLDKYFKKYKVILGVDRLDYTKGLVLRLLSLEKFLENNKNYIGKVIYLGIMAPSRDRINAYKEMKEDIQKTAERINNRFGTKDWKPLHLVYDVLKREDVISFYKKADLCLVTPRDDGMNLVSKEYVLVASLASNPGMLVLSEFAGSATDLTSALIVNPYDFNGVADAIKQGLEMSKEEKIKRMRLMAEVLDEKNVYDWALSFVKAAIPGKT